MTAEPKVLQKKLKSPVPVPGTDEKVTDLVIVHDLIYVYEDPSKPGLYINANCQHCVYPMCLASCPEEAIYKDDLGIVRISSLQCVGCGICSEACPIGIPRLDEERKVYVKCDLCDGDYPMCFQMCSPGALNLLPRKEAYEYVKKIRGAKIVK